MSWTGRGTVQSAPWSVQRTFLFLLLSQTFTERPRTGLLPGQEVDQVRRVVWLQEMPVAGRWGDWLNNSLCWAVHSLLLSDEMLVSDPDTVMVLPPDLPDPSCSYRTLMEFDFIVNRHRRIIWCHPEKDTFPFKVGFSQVFILVSSQGDFLAIGVSDTFILCPNTWVCTKNCVYYSK